MTINTIKDRNTLLTIFTLRDGREVMTIEILIFTFGKGRQPDFLWKIY